MSGNGLNSDVKRAIKAAVLSLRALLEGEFDAQTGMPVPPAGDVVRQLGRFGILPDRPEALAADQAPDYLNDDEKTKRKRVCAAIRREAALFGPPGDKQVFQKGFRAFVRETSYTWINRFLGLRCMEARGLLTDEHGEPDFVVTPADDYGGLPRRAWRFRGQDPARWQQSTLYDLQCAAIADACRQLTGEIKVLFDPDHDYGLLWPTPTAFNAILEKIRELGNLQIKGVSPEGGSNPFAAPDFLGWVYQYFQTLEKDLIFAAASKKGKKIEKDAIIPATQIYTEHYMVEYLVQNTLGRLWLEMHPDSRLADTWAYYVKPPEGNPTVKRPLKKARDLKVMDPAVGSGHFHLVGFDLLAVMYREELENAGRDGWPEEPSATSPDQIPVAILEQNLFGMDIDTRAIQLATLALVMKARETGYGGPIGKIHLVALNSAPFESSTWHELIRNLQERDKPSVARVLAALGQHLKNLDEFGSLLRIEEEMRKIIGEEKQRWLDRRKKSMENALLFPEMAKPRQEELLFEKDITDGSFFDRLEPEIQAELDRFYQKAVRGGLADEAILAADAGRGFDFLHLSLERYDVVYTNPPYMGSKNMGERLKKFVAANYPQGKRDLYAAFILRCRELAEGNGYVGMVTQQSWMFLRSFADLRALPEEKLAKAKGDFTGLLRESTIETLAHLGPRAFSEISGEVVNIALFTLRNSPPVKEHRMTAFRLVGPKSAEEKERLLNYSMSNKHLSIITKPHQSKFIDIPQAPMSYWLEDIFMNILAGPTVREKAKIVQQIITADNPRFLRYFWEIPILSGRWIGYLKAGGYGRWAGYEHMLVDWEDNGQTMKLSTIEKYPYFKGNWGFLIKEKTFFREGWTYTLMAQGCLGVRKIPGNFICDSVSPAILSISNSNGLGTILNSRITSYLLRSISSEIKFRESYVGRVPLPQNFQPDRWQRIESLCVDIKRLIIAFDHSEFSYEMPFPIRYKIMCEHFENLSLWLHSLEGIIEKNVNSAFSINDDNAQIIFAETGTPAGWHPLIRGYDVLPNLPEGLLEIPQEVIVFLDKHTRCELEAKALQDVKNHLRILYEAGPGAKVDMEENNVSADDEEGDDEHIAVGAYIPIPAETFLEELSQKLEIHSISVYWLLKEMREKEGLVCPSEMKRHAEDYVSVMILRMLGYQWPKQVEAGEPLPEWADSEGIIPLTDGLGMPMLLDRIRRRFGADFGEEREAAIESEFANIVGKSLERWLAEDFFARHVKQFKSRPIAWHLVSNPDVANHTETSGKKRKKAFTKKRSPAFSALIHYHGFVDGDQGYQMLQLLKNQYLEKLLSRMRIELESLRGKENDPAAFDRVAELDRRLLELEDFRARLERIQDGLDREARIYVRWKSQEEQPRGWRPDINDGVRINIAPWERLGMFPVKKIVGEVEKGPE